MICYGFPGGDLLLLLLGASFPLRKAHGGAVMGDKGGSKDKGKREKQKKAQLSPKEKKKLKAEKKKK